jgi:hypothetical protein
VNHGVRVLPAVSDLLRSTPTVIVLVRTEEPERALPALHAAMREFSTTTEPGPAFQLGPVLLAPHSVLLMLDLGEDMPGAVRRRLPGLLTRHLEQAGIRTATIGPAPRVGDRYTLLDSFRPFARAWIRGTTPPGPTVPVGRPSAALTGLALSWVDDQPPPAHELLGLVVSTEIPLTPDSRRPFVDGVLRSHHADALRLLSTDFTTQGRVASFGQFLGHGIALGAGGIGWSAATRAAPMLAQRELIRAHADAIDWAGISVHPADRWFLAPAAPNLTFFLSSRPPDTAALAADVTANMWYQLLSPLQLERLGGPPAGSVALPAGRYELSNGAPHHWPGACESECE